MPEAPVAVPPAQEISGFNEAQNGHLNNYLQCSLNAVNALSDLDTGFPYSVFDPAQGDFEQQKSHTDLADIGRALTTNTYLHDLKELPPVWSNHRTHQILATIDEVMHNGRCYKDGLFIQHLRPDGRDDTFFDGQIADRFQHAMLLRGLQVAGASFPQWQGYAEDLSKKILYGIFNNRNGYSLPTINEYGEVELVSDNVNENKVIPLFRKPPQSTKLYPAEIMTGLVAKPYETVQTLEELIHKYPEIYNSDMGFMHSVDTATGEVNKLHYYKDLTKIIGSIRKYKQNAQPASSAEIIRETLPEARQAA